MNIVQWIKLNYAALDCETLQGLNEWALYASLATSDIGGAPADVAWLAIQTAIRSAWFVSGCDNDPPALPDDPQWDPDQKCQKVSAGGTGWYTQYESDGGQTFHEFTPENTCLEIIGFESTDFGGWKIEHVQIDGNVTFSTIYNQGKYIYPWIKPQKNSYCVGQAPNRPPPPDEPIGPTIPVPQLDDDPDCQWTIEPVDTHVDAQGTYWTRFFVTSNDPIKCGSSFYYWSSQRGPTFCPPDGDCPAPDGGGSGTTWSEPILTEWTYFLDGVCEDPEEWGLEAGQQPEFKWTIPQSTALLAIARRVDAIAEMINMQGALKTPVCDPSPPLRLQGDFRTLSFISDEKSPNGKSRLRKRFRYRSSSGWGLADIVEHWKDFVWQAGPVCVKHVGADWGSPQVWAASIDEGKRVIRHAAGETGFDADQVGRWEVGGSTSTRVGMPGTMRINTKGGYYWISARDGSENRPIVAKT